MYPASMHESIRKLNETRNFRMTQQIPLLTPDAKQDLLKKFHPDFIASAMREIEIGPNKGERTPHEFANLFEAYSLIDPAKFEIKKPDIEVDVLIIGGGGAGCSAALQAQAAGAKALQVTKLRIGDANTTMAQGGIQAADKANDSPAIHYLDVIGGGGFKNIPELANALVNDAPGIIAWLEEIGVMFDKDPDGNMQTIHGGGTSRKRMHACRDYTGLEIMRCVKDEVLNRQIKIMEFTAAIELLTDENGRCVGAVLLNLENGQVLIAKTKSVVIATGGAGRLHVQGFPTTNHYGATADGLVIAYRAGAKLAFLDTIQYHPTGVAFPTQIVGQLITEKTRSVGAQLVNAEGDRFIYDLETRDTVASAIIRECKERKKGITTPTGDSGVWLDTPLIEMVKGPGAIIKQLPAMYRQFINFNIDMTKEPILTYPTQHYQNGGILCNEFGETNILGLLVAGEVSGGVHGRNRLMGNSLLDILVFGRRAGTRAAELATKTTWVNEGTLAHVKRYHQELKKAGIATERKSPMLLPDYRPEEFQERYSFLSHIK